MIVTFGRRTRVLLSAVIVLVGVVGCGGAGGGAGGGSAATPPSVTGPIPQSAVIRVTSQVHVTPNGRDMLSPLAPTVEPKLSAEAVRQKLLSSRRDMQLYIGDGSEVIVKLGVYDDPLTPTGSGKPFYVFSGGPLPRSDCPTTGGGPVVSPPPGFPTANPSEVPRTPDPNAPCYFILATGADDAAGGFLETFNAPAP